MAALAVVQTACNAIYCEISCCDKIFSKLIRVREKEALGVGWEMEVNSVLQVSIGTRLLELQGILQNSLTWRFLKKSDGETADFLVLHKECH